MAESRKKPSEAEIRASLYEQLEAKEADVPHFEDLIEEYMQFWKIAKKLQADIRKRGINYPETMSTGITKIVSNPSVKDLATVSKQKQAILEKLGISPDKTIGADGDEL